MLTLPLLTLNTFASGDIKIRAWPGQKVFLDGEFKGMTKDGYTFDDAEHHREPKPDGLTIRAVPAGSHIIRTSIQGFRDRKKRVLVKDNDVVEVRMTPSPTLDRQGIPMAYMPIGHDPGKAGMPTLIIYTLFFILALVFHKKRKISVGLFGIATILALGFAISFFRRYYFELLVYDGGMVRHSIFQERKQAIVYIACSVLSAIIWLIVLYIAWARKYIPFITVKTRIKALLLCLFFGGLGLHRFYVGKKRSGIVQLLTLGGFGFWSFWDLITIFLGTFTDKDGRYPEDW